MFWSVVLGILAFILILAIVVIIHELGHFLLARRAGILCYEFSFGMGPVLFQKKIGETVYMIKLFPIGGYVAMAGEEVEQNALKGVELCQIIDPLGPDENIVSTRQDPRSISKIIIDRHLFDPKLPIYHIENYDIIGSQKQPELFIELKRVDHYHADQALNTIEYENNPLNYFSVAKNALIVYNHKQSYPVAPYDRNFVNKTIGQRFLAILAGPLMNFVLALFIFMLIGVIQGYPADHNTIINNIESSQPAYLAGLRDGDKIVYISSTDLDLENLNSQNYFKEWNDISNRLEQIASGENEFDQIYVYYYRGETLNKAVVNPNVIINMIGLIFDPNGTNDLKVSYLVGLDPLPKEMTITKINGISFNTRSEVLDYFNSQITDEEYSFELEYTYIDDANQVVTDVYPIESKSRQVYLQSGIELTKVQLGISPIYQRSFVKTLYRPFVDVADSALLIFRTIGLLATDSSVGIKDLSGPVGIASYTVQIIQGGFLALLRWTAVLSVNLGLFNIFPLPALDGGRITFLGYELITRKRPNAKVENIIHLIGFILLMGLFVFVLYNDIIRLFFGG